MKKLMVVLLVLALSSFAYAQGGPGGPRGRGFMGGRGIGPGFGPGFRGGVGREVVPGIKGRVEENKKEVNDEKTGIKNRAEVKRPAFIGRGQRPQFRNFAPMGRGRGFQFRNFAPMGRGQGFQCQRNCQRGFLMNKNDGRRSFKRIERLGDKDKRERSLKGSEEKLHRGDVGRKGLKKGIRKETGRRGEFKGEFKGRNSKSAGRKRSPKK